MGGGAGSRQRWRMPIPMRRRGAAVPQGQYCRLPPPPGRVAVTTLTAAPKPFPTRICVGNGSGNVVNVVTRGTATSSVKSVAAEDPHPRGYCYTHRGTFSRLTLVGVL